MIEPPAAGENRTTHVNQAVRLSPGQKGDAAMVLTRAFHHDPLYVRLIPKEPERVQCLTWLWEAVIHTSLVLGEVYTTPMLHGVACWLAPGQTDMNIWRALQSGLALPRAVMRFRPPTRKRMMDAVSQIDDARRTLMHGKYWYLWALGVEPGCQGQGIGRALLQPILTCADQGGLPCFLETETERNVTFYTKHGFHVAREENIEWLGQRIWMLRREPR